MIRLAEKNDLGQLLALYAAARKRMKAAGNPTQWGEDYPSEQLLAEDIRQKQLYVMTNGKELYGAFVLAWGEDATYRKIEGEWKDFSAYATIHRLAGKTEKKGVFWECLDFCQQQSAHLRADTHSDNGAMRHLLEKSGFAYCGIIYVEDGSPRRAYEWSRKDLRVD